MAERVQITGTTDERYVEILSPKALELLVLLHDALADRRAALLAARRSRQAQLSAGALLDFLPETAHIREDASWRVAPPAAGLVDRRVEITGPTDRKMTINALNSGAKVWLADFEDANTPLWENMIEGQLNLEARMWNDAFNIAQDYLGIPRGTIRATVLIETIPAAFEMDEILYELREHSAGLNTGRWDYLFSVIKKFRTRGREFMLPERNAVTMTAPAMRAYTDLLVQTCHKRGAFAMGGMAAFIPSRRDAAVNEVALAKVREDKTREAGDGFDGSWVAHPDLVPICREVFDGVLGTRPNQLDKQRPEVAVTAGELLAFAKTPGGVTEAGLRNNISVALQYLANWLSGTGAVAIFNLMEDAATAEISRSQIWQWIHNDVILDDGPLVTKDVVERMIDEELVKIHELAGDDFDPDMYGQAVALFTEVALADSFAEFLTLAADERMP